MKTLIKSIIMVMALVSQAIANPLVGPSEVSISSAKQNLYEAFVDTRIDGRIVELKFAKRKNKKV